MLFIQMIRIFIISFIIVAFNSLSKLALICSLITLFIYYCILLICNPFKLKLALLSNLLIEFCIIGTYIIATILAYMDTSFTLENYETLGELFYYLTLFASLFTLFIFVKLLLIYLYYP